MVSTVPAPICIPTNSAVGFPKMGIHSNKNLPQETKKKKKKKSNKQYNFTLNEQIKKEQTKPMVSNRKEIIKIRAEID